MKKQCKPFILLIMNILLVLNLLIFWSIRSMWSGIIAIAGKPAPYILFIILVTTTFLITTLNMYKKPLFPAVIFACFINILFLGLSGYILSVTLDSLHYFVIEFFRSTAFLGGIALFIYLCFYSFRVNWLQKKWIQPVCILVLTIIGFLISFDIQLFNGFDKTPVVYAVEDTYQITFTTTAKGEAWVVIDGVEYNDTYAGGRKTENTIHKICVPMHVLDATDSYTIYTRAMILRGPYESLQGKTISKTFTWKGVTPENGLNYYAFSDNHLSSKAPAAAASYWGEDLDFLIALGDTANWLDNEDELTQLLYLASDITKGEIPVIYARGNHEAQGLRFDEYHNYVGADNENFYYTFRLQNIWGIVLDLGVNHEDEYNEYAGTAKYDTYRDAQTSFLDEVLANAESEYLADGVDYRIGICHIPLTISNVDDPLLAYKNAWVERLNQMHLTVFYGGHFHELMFSDASMHGTFTQTSAYTGKTENTDEYYLADANFASILVSKRGTAQICTDKENVFDKHFIGVAASVEGNETILKFTDESGKIVKTVSPWIDGLEYGKEIRVQNVK
ncbi:MAG: metallophosphoesterase [Agathobacter sp.]|nr:metallophosphoesterase [Agathobacter sp.]